jgi:hypothetical protein
MTHGLGAGFWLLVSGGPIPQQTGRTLIFYVADFKSSPLVCLLRIFILNYLLFVNVLPRENQSWAEQTEGVPPLLLPVKQLGDL